MANFGDLTGIQGSGAGWASFARFLFAHEVTVGQTALCKPRLLRQCRVDRESIPVQPLCLCQPIFVFCRPGGCPGS
jgi:hypothetical protein